MELLKNFLSSKLVSKNIHCRKYPSAQLETFFATLNALQQTFTFLKTSFPPDRGGEEVESFTCNTRSCIVILQNFFMRAFSILYVYQKIRQVRLGLKNEQDLCVFQHQLNFHQLQSTKIFDCCLQAYLKIQFKLNR